MSIYEKNIHFTKSKRRELSEEWVNKYTRYICRLMNNRKNLRCEKQKYMAVTIIKKIIEDIIKKQDKYVSVQELIFYIDIQINYIIRIGYEGCEIILLIFEKVHDYLKVLSRTQENCDLEHVKEHVKSLYKKNSFDDSMKKQIASKLVTMSEKKSILVYDISMTILEIIEFVVQEVQDVRLVLLESTYNHVGGIIVSKLNKMNVDIVFFRIENIVAALDRVDIVLLKSKLYMKNLFFLTKLGTDLILDFAIKKKKKVVLMCSREHTCMLDLFEKIFPNKTKVQISKSSPVIINKNELSCITTIFLKKYIHTDSDYKVTAKAPYDLIQTKKIELVATEEGIISREDFVHLVMK